MTRVCVKRCASAAEAVAWLKAWTDNGSMHSAMWKAKGGGQREWKQYVCNAHAACKVTATVRRGMDMQFIVEVDSERRHADEDNLKRRRNSPLDVYQEQRAKDSIRHDGATPKSLTSAAQNRALDSGASPLEEVGVEGELPRLPMRQQSAVGTDSSGRQQRNQLPKLCLHSACVLRAFYVHFIAFYA